MSSPEDQAVQPEASIQEAPPSATVDAPTSSPQDAAAPEEAQAEVPVAEPALSPDVEGGVSPTAADPSEAEPASSIEASAEPASSQAAAAAHASSGSPAAAESSASTEPASVVESASTLAAPASAVGSVKSPPDGVAAHITALPALAQSNSTPEQQQKYSDKARSLPMTGEFKSLRDAEALPELPQPGPPLELPPFARRGTEEEVAFWKAQIKAFERDAEGMADASLAARIALEVGRIYEEQLGRPRNAATSYQRAFTLDPGNPAVLHASRRLFTEVGNWGMVLEILGFEVEAASTSERKATLLTEKGAIQEDKLNDVDAARVTYEAALDTWSAEPIAVAALERIYGMQKAFGELDRIYMQAVEATEKPERKLPLWIAAAQLAEDRLEQPKQAIERYQAVLAIDPVHTLALDALRRLYLATESWAEYAQVLLQAANVAQSPEESAQLLLTMARVQNERLEETEPAVHTLIRALEQAPEDLIVLREIERLYEDNDRHEEVIKVLEREAEITTDVREKVPILFKLGAILDEQLNRPDEAVTALQEAVKLMPTYTPVKQSLGRLLVRSERWQDLADLFQQEFEAEEDEWVRVSKLFQLADIRGSRLDAVPAAIEALQQALSLKPDYQPARKLLEKLLVQTEAWADLSALYESELELVEDKARKVFLLLRIGNPVRSKAVDAETSRGAYARILDLEPGNLHAIRSLQTLAEEREDWDEALRLLELEADASEDQKEVVSILHRAGALREAPADDVDGAIVDYEKALTLNPTYLPALRSLGRLYAKKGRFEDLVTMYRRELDVTRSLEQRLQLLFRSADVLAEQIKAPERSAAVLQEILELEPSNLPALRALAAIHAKEGSFEALADVLVKEANSVTDTKEKATLLIQAAETLEDKLTRGDQAAELYQEVIRHGHYVDSAIRALVRIYSVEGLWNALSRALCAAKDHAKDPSAKVAILLRLAEVAGDRLGQMAHAAEYLEEAVALDPDNVVILAQLERTSVSLRDWPKAVEAANQLAMHEADPRLFGARQIRIAYMKETQLDPPVSGAEHYCLALQTVPDHPSALRALELAYRRAGDWQALRLFYQREAFVTKNPAEQAGLFARAADIAEHRLKDDDSAAMMYERALEGLPDFLPVLRSRRRVATRRGDTEVALDSIRREGELTGDLECREELLLQSAELYEEKLGQIEPAIANYRQLLERDPGHPVAFTKLESIFGAAQRTSDLGDLYSARVEAVRDVSEQAELLFRAAGLALKAAQEAGATDKSEAIQLYGKVLEREPDHAKALMRLGPLFFEAQEWDAAIGVFHRTLTVTKEAAARRVALDALGVIYHEHRQDLVKCVQSLQAALQYDPSDVESLTRLAKVYQEAQDWNSSVNVMLRLAEVVADPRLKVSTLLELGELYEVRLGDEASAILAARKVLELDVGNEAAVLRLVRLHERAEQWQELADAAARFVSLLPASDKAKAAPLHLKMSAVFEKRMGDDARAINALKYALEAHPESVDALASLARLYAKSPETAMLAVDAHRRLLAVDPFRVDSYHEMHRLFERTGAHDKAFVVAEILVFMRAALQDEELYYQEHKSKVAPHPERTLNAADHDRWVTHPAERGPMRAVMELLAPELTKAFPGAMTRYDLNKSTDRHGPRSPMALRRLADEIAEALGGAPTYDIWVTRKFDLDVFTENEKPLALVVGSNVGRRIQERDQRFLLGRAIAQLKGGHHLLATVPAKDMLSLIWTVAKNANPSGQAPVDPASLEVMQRILKGLPGRVRRALDEVGGGLFNTHVDVQRHRAAAAHTANRAGLVMTNDIEVAVRNMAKNHPEIRPVFRDPEGARATIGKIPGVPQLLNYAVSEDYFAARTKLGFSIQS